MSKKKTAGCWVGAPREGFYAKCCGELERMQQSKESRLMVKFSMGGSEHMGALPSAPWRAYPEKKLVGDEPELPVVPAD